MGILNFVIIGLVGLLCLGLCYLIVRGSSFLKEKLKDLQKLIPIEQNVIIDNLFDCAATVINKTAAAAVGKLEQIIGKDLREMVKDGKADKNELYALAEDAYKEVINTVSPEIMEDLREYIGDTELYIRNVIETELLKLKNSIKG